MKQLRILAPQEYLSTCFLYDESSGKLFWKKRPLEHFSNRQSHSYFNNRYAGAEAFTHRDHKGHKRGMLDGKTYFAHRIIWKLKTGEEPPAILDHRDRVPDNNRWGNLRPATNTQNCWNRKLSKSNKTGCTGVVFHRRTNCWHALVDANGRRVFVGAFAEKSEAVAARVDAARKLHGGFASQ